MDDKLTYSNPRLKAVIEDWPLSFNKRGTAVFAIEADKRGERCVRTTTGKAKLGVYCNKARIVDGSDGRTYIARLYGNDMVSIMRGDMKFEQETVFDRDERFPALLALFQG